MHPFTLFQSPLIMWPSSSSGKPGVWPLCELCRVFSLQPQYGKINPNLIKQRILSSCLCWAVKSLCCQRNSALQKMCSKFSSQPSAGAAASPDLAPGSDLKWSLCIIQLCIHLEGILFFHLSPRMLTVQLKLFLTKNIAQKDLKTCLTIFFAMPKSYHSQPYLFYEDEVDNIYFYISFLHEQWFFNISVWNSFQHQIKSLAFHLLLLLWLFLTAFEDRILILYPRLNSTLWTTWPHIPSVRITGIYHPKAFSHDFPQLNLLKMMLLHGEEGFTTVTTYFVFWPLYNFIYRLESNVSFECRHYEQFNTQIGSSCHSHKTFRS